MVEKHVVSAGWVVYFESVMGYISLKSFVFHKTKRYRKIRIWEAGRHFARYPECRVALPSQLCKKSLALTSVSKCVVTKGACASIRMRWETKMERWLKTWSEFVNLSKTKVNLHKLRERNKAFLPERNWESYFRRVWLDIKHNIQSTIKSCLQQNLKTLESSHIHQIHGYPTKRRCHARPLRFRWKGRQEEPWSATISPLSRHAAPLRLWHSWVTR